MPTGLTQRLEEEHDYNLRQWLEETLSRQFGMCVLLRDHEYMPKEQVIDRLENSNKYRYVPQEPVFRTKDMAYKEYLQTREYYQATLQKSILQKEMYELKILPEFDKIKKQVEQTVDDKYDLLKPVLSLAAEQINIAKEEYTNSIKYCKEYLEKEFKYDEQYEKEYYEKQLLVYKERVESEQVDKSEGYKEFLSQVEEVYKQLILTKEE